MQWLIGVDEVGRGCIAGPVAVGLVRCPKEYPLLERFPGLNDSKQLSPKKREKIMGLVEERVAIGDPLEIVVVYRDAHAIDARGIAVCIREAVAEGLDALVPHGSSSAAHQDCFVHLDGGLVAPARFSQKTTVRGDTLIPAIMLASVVAKVTRDRFMESLDTAHPLYHFACHKGYGTALHYAALRQHGSSAIHRTTFLHLDHP